MDVGFYAATSAGREFFDEWPVGILDEALQDFFDLLGGGEGMKALGALSDFSSCLHAPKKQDGDDGILS